MAKWVLKYLRVWLATVGAFLERFEVSLEASVALVCPVYLLG